MRFLVCRSVLFALVCWWDAACAFTTTSTILPPLSAPQHSHYRHRLPAGRHVPSTRTTLYASPSDSSNSNNNNNSTNLTPQNTKTNDDTPWPFSWKKKDSSLVVDVPILVSDLLALAVAMQLLGLTNVLNDPTFWNQGGWLQPITPSGIAHTLPVVVQRFCLVGIAWFSSALVSGQGWSLESSSSETRGSLIKLLVPFFGVLLLLEGMVALATTTTVGGLELTQDVVLQTFQLWYFSAIALVAGRYLVRQLPFY